MPEGRVLVSYRPTVRQLLSRNALACGVIGLGALVVIAVIAMGGVDSLWVYVGALLLVTGLAVAVVIEHSRRGGVDVTEQGLRRVGTRSTRFVPWSQVLEIRTERRGWSTVVVVALTNGRRLRLRAPYDSDWLDHDPDFEPKFFNLRNLWETYRTRPPAGSADG